MVRCGLRLGAPELVDEARAYAAILPVAELCSETRRDVVTGSAGLLLSVLPVAEACPAFVAAAVARTFDGQPESPRFPPYPASEELDGLPDEADGRALIAARLGLGGDAAGAGHSIAARIAAGEERAIAELDVLLGLDRAVPERSHDALERIETALAAFRATADSRYLDVAAASAAALQARHAASGSWFTNSFAADGHRLSVLTGLAAVAHGFLRLYDPERVASIRLLE
jgi:hypothetical protein